MCKLFDGKKIPFFGGVRMCELGGCGWMVWRDVGCGSG